MSFSKTLVRERGGGYIEEEREGEGNERRDKYETRNEWRENLALFMWLGGMCLWGDILRERERETDTHTMQHSRNQESTVYNLQ